MRPLGVAVLLRLPRFPHDNHPSSSPPPWPPLHCCEPIRHARVFGAETEAAFGLTTVYPAAEENYCDINAHSHTTEVDFRKPAGIFGRHLRQASSAASSTAPSPPARALAARPRISVDIYSRAMKRARDGQHQQHQQQEQDIPPPPPPRKRKGFAAEEQDIPPPPPPRKRKGFAAEEQDIPPPPPPRKTEGLAGANGSSARPSAASASIAVAAGTAWSRMNGNLQAGDCGGGSEANVFSGSSSSSSASASLPSSTPACAAPKRSKLGLGQLDGWRAAADEVLLKAGIGEGGSGAGLSTRGGVEGVPALGEGVRGKKDLPDRTTAAARSKRRFAVVCAANFNRSMMAHELLRKHNFRVESYGTSRLGVVLKFFSMVLFIANMWYAVRGVMVYCTATLLFLRFEVFDSHGGDNAEARIMFGFVLPVKTVDCCYR